MAKQPGTPKAEAAPFSWSGEGVVYDVSAMANSVAASYAMGER